jgi:hypothetical protein
LAVLAEITRFARGGIGCDYALAHSKSSDILAGSHHISGQLMSEDRRWDNHARMVAALEHLNIGAAGKGHLHPDEDVSTINLGNGYRLYLQVFLAVKDGSHHLAFSHYEHL